jgi:hypothetical protein
MAGSSAYDHLDPSGIVSTVGILSARIAERFPDSGLSQVCHRLHEIARQARVRSLAIGRPIWPLRVVIGGLIIVLAVGTLATYLALPMEGERVGFLRFVEVLEPGVNVVVLIGAAIFFLITLEKRIKRGRALKAIHEVRSIAHIIDMHQLTKDPDRILWKGEDTATSPRRELSAFELARYLDYCTEMLSLAGKIAAVYVEGFDDAVAIASVNQVETMTTGLARKIWQKIMILNAASSRAGKVKG